MAYEFNVDEAIPAAVERLALEQIERIHEHLTATDETPEDRIHGARKRIKEMRALLRLVRKPLGEHFGIENIWYRDAGRSLAIARDAAAMIESIEKLRKHVDDPAVRRSLRKVILALRSHPPKTDSAKIDAL